MLWCRYLFITIFSVIFWNQIVCVWSNIMDIFCHGKLVKRLAQSRYVPRTIFTSPCYVPWKTKQCNFRNLIFFDNNFLIYVSYIQLSKNKFGKLYFGNYWYCKLNQIKNFFLFFLFYKKHTYKELEAEKGSYKKRNS